MDSYASGFHSCTCTKYQLEHNMPKLKPMVQFLRMGMRYRPRNIGFKFQLNQTRTNSLNARRDYIFCNCLYCVSFMVTITSHIFVNIVQTIHFTAVKFTRGTEKNRSFLLIPKSQKVWNKSAAIGLGSFKVSDSYCFMLRRRCWCWLDWSNNEKENQKQVNGKCKMMEFTFKETHQQQWPLNWWDR